ncbi:MAG: class I SAM-dependent methyltransferase [Chitinivibrionales bacterium]|nr:class I SAM-dependent methyltransferase [Chitinivibrionales bacterium]
MANNLRNFSNQKHATGHWKTKSLYTRNLLVRAFANFISLKREGVDWLATTIPAENNKAIILDLGSGNGAYSHWFLGRHEAVCIACDWSFGALKSLPIPRRGKIIRIVADIHSLPFKQESIDAACSVDVLGHVERVNAVLDEVLRVVKSGASLFIHSECADYRARWPDRALVQKLGDDRIASLDGHLFLQKSESLRALLVRRFLILRFESPAGIAGWCLGYPEKYRPLLHAAGMSGWALLCAMFAFVKKTPLAGAGLRLLNALTNRLELTLGLSGGGSCFARLKKYQR